MSKALVVDRELILHLLSCWDAGLEIDNELEQLRIAAAQPAVAGDEREAFQEAWSAGEFPDAFKEDHALCLSAFKAGAAWQRTRPAQTEQPALTVWEGAMPESNGKSNFTAILMRKGGKLFNSMSEGMAIARSEYPDRVRYEADCVRWLIGELKRKPCITDYDADKHSGYVAPVAQTAKGGE